MFVFIFMCLVGCLTEAAASRADHGRVYIPREVEGDSKVAPSPGEAGDKSSDPSLSSLPEFGMPSPLPREIQNNPTETPLVLAETEKETETASVSGSDVWWEEGRFTPRTDKSPSLVDETRRAKQGLRKFFNQARDQQETAQKGVASSPSSSKWDGRERVSFDWSKDDALWKWFKLGVRRVISFDEDGTAKDFVEPHYLRKRGRVRRTALAVVAPLFITLLPVVLPSIVLVTSAFYATHLLFRYRHQRQDAPPS
uniref:Transmembrane protein n=1 Tax=Chromera velia CCMP2878 TaxID=1169474 RepID=A0A0G4HRB6_9ALVE|eukprot:Cvel_8060.t1-p1 / transcript=Cvel_8060.t1 / gene=Cvel_8060 / organism=Chromera_velia_CCMP2878 / gene_product=hypothetical protein / transcript_product=hypothetical protein / location=Cvel_scaffold436:42365-43208(+) / protein_length=253 / sequence_SO=supercontig / SO=protein_coding / is_pseudo=false